jgi:hypothetical protein
VAVRNVMRSCTGAQHLYTAAETSSIRTVPGPDLLTPPGHLTRFSKADLYALRCPPGMHDTSMTTYAWSPAAEASSCIARDCPLGALLRAVGVAAHATARAYKTSVSAVLHTIHDMHRPGLAWLSVREGACRRLRRYPWPERWGERAVKGPGPQPLAAPGARDPSPRAPAVAHGGRGTHRAGRSLD